MNLRARTWILGAFVLLVAIGIGALLWRQYPAARLAVAVLLIAVAGLEIGFWVVRRTAKSFGNITRAVKAVEAGEYRSGQLAGLIQRKDELGKLSRAIDSMASAKKLCPIAP